MSCRLCPIICGFFYIALDPNPRSSTSYHVQYLWHYRIKLTLICSLYLCVKSLPSIILHNRMSFCIGAPMLASRTTRGWSFSGQPEVLNANIWNHAKCVDTNLTPCHYSTTKSNTVKSDTVCCWVLTFYLTPTLFHSDGFLALLI